MRSDLQRAALERLARLTHNGQLSPERRGSLADRVLTKCHDQKKLVNGVNGSGGSRQTMVCHVNVHLLTLEVKNRVQFAVGSYRTTY
jgi:hypothetical protein